jgi:hypothetical protein
MLAEEKLDFIINYDIMYLKRQREAQRGATIDENEGGRTLDLVSNLQLPVAIPFRRYQV